MTRGAVARGGGNMADVQTIPDVMKPEPALARAPELVRLYGELLAYDWIEINVGVTSGQKIGAGMFTRLDKLVLVNLLCLKIWLCKTC